MKIAMEKKLEAEDELTFSVNNFPLTLFLSEDGNGNRNSSKEQPSLIPEFPIGKKGFPKNTDCGVPN